MTDLIKALIEKVKCIYPSNAEYYADPEKAFDNLANHTNNRSGYRQVWGEIISQIQHEFPKTYTEDRTIPDIYDPGIRMHFYDENDKMKMVFIKSLLANIIGVYAIDMKARPAFDSVTTNHDLTEILETNPQLRIYHKRICEIILGKFPDHFIFPTEADKLAIDDIVAPLAGDGGIGKPVKLF